MLRVMVTGAGGMLGTALLAQAPERVAVSGVDLADGDLTQPGVAAALLAQHRPETVVHCAAWADVDGCTRDPKRAMLHNGEATRLLAEACAGHGSRLLYISTDYVFPGNLGRPYVETDAPAPLSPYGASKLAGELAVARVPDHVITRTQWLYGPSGKNFVATIVQAARTRGELRVVSDEYGSPTYTLDLAAALWRVAQSDVGGLLHLTGSGICSWYDLAVAAVASAGLSVPIHPVGSADWGSVTVRPKFSALSSQRWRGLGFPPLRPWPEAVREYVARYL